MYYGVVIARFGESAEAQAAAFVATRKATTNSALHIASMYVCKSYTSCYAPLLVVTLFAVPAHVTQARDGVSRRGAPASRIWCRCIVVRAAAVAIAQSSAALHNVSSAAFDHRARVGLEKLCDCLGIAVDVCIT